MAYSCKKRTKKDKQVVNNENLVETVTETSSETVTVDVIENCDNPENNNEILVVKEDKTIIQNPVEEEIKDLPEYKNISVQYIAQNTEKNETPNKTTENNNQQLIQGVTKINGRVSEQERKRRWLLGFRN